MTVSRRNLSVLVSVLLIDEQMPKLKDTELRVLLVVLRQTQVQGKENASAWLTHGELCRRTGRASEAVSAAVDALVRRGIMQVRDEEGNVLVTTAQRQARTGKRFYRVLLGVTTLEQSHTSNIGKAKTIEVTNKVYSFRKAEEKPLPVAVPSALDAERRIEQEKARIRTRLRSLSEQKKR